MDDAARMFDEANAELVFHLAAEVGGIGANRANPGRYWFANLAMGANVLEQARLHSTPKLVIVGTVCAYPKFAPVPFSEDDLWNGYPEETNAPYGVAKKAVLVGAQAYREQYGLDAIFLLPTNLTGHATTSTSRPRTSSRRSSGKMVEADGEVRALGRRLADPRVPLRGRLRRRPRAGGRALRRRRPGQPGCRSRDLDRELAELIADVTGTRAAIDWDTTKPNGSRGGASTARGRASSSASRHARPCVRGSSAPSPGIARRSRVSVAIGPRRPPTGSGGRSIGCSSDHGRFSAH